jgi:hypothetical protein
MSIRIDHITVTCPSLSEGSDWVFNEIGIRPDRGGEHPKMGTHNLLLRLGETQFLEVIAVNPLMEKPNRARWFGLDDVTVSSKSALTCWVARTDDIEKSLKCSSERLGEVEAISRGMYEWLISIPSDGRPVLDGAAPTLIQWKCHHPATNLVEHGCHLLNLEIQHPHADRLSTLLASIEIEENADTLIISKAETPRIVARISTPNGVRLLG